MVAHPEAKFNGRSSRRRACAGTLSLTAAPENSYTRCGADAQQQ
jgi:hypothetical protein